MSEYKLIAKEGYDDGYYWDTRLGKRKACIIKADTCDRNCTKCELLRNTEDLLSAYDLVNKILKQEPILDKIRAEVIARYPKNYAGEPESGGRACEFSLNQILRIIDKYNVESEE